MRMKHLQKTPEKHLICAKTYATSKSKRLQQRLETE
jgi:hypothetical protein